jgi:hypothetical protein
VAGKVLASVHVLIVNVAVNIIDETGIARLSERGSAKSRQMLI